MSEYEQSFIGRDEVSLHPSEYLKKTSVIVYLMTFMFIYASITSDIFRNPGVYYLLLLLTLLMITLWYEGETKEDVFPREHFKLSNVPHQVLGGFMFGFGYLFLMLGIGTILPRTATVATPEHFAGTLILMIVIVGMVETIMLIVYVRIVWMGIIIFPFFFAYIHVAPLWTQGIFTQDSIFFFVYAVMNAFLFIAMFMARDAFRPALDKKGNPLENKHAYKFFGAVTAAVYHGFINVISVFAIVTIGGVALGV